MNCAMNPKMLDHPQKNFRAQQHFGARHNRSPIDPLIECTIGVLASIDRVHNRSLNIHWSSAQWES